MKTGEIVAVWVKVKKGRNNLHHAGITITKQWQELNVDRATRAAYRAHPLIDVRDEDPNPIENTESLQADTASQTAQTAGDHNELATGGAEEGPVDESGEEETNIGEEGVAKTDTSTVEENNGEAAGDVTENPADEQPTEKIDKPKPKPKPKAKEAAGEPAKTEEG